MLAASSTTLQRTSQNQAVWGKGMSCTGWRNHSSCRAKQTARSTRRDGYAGSGGLSSPRGSAATLALTAVGFGPESIPVGLLVPGVRPSSYHDFNRDRLIRWHQPRSVDSLALIVVYVLPGLG